MKTIETRTGQLSECCCQQRFTFWFSRWKHFDTESWIVGHPTSTSPKTFTPTPKWFTTHQSTRLQDLRSPLRKSHPASANPGPLPSSAWILLPPLPRQQRQQLCLKFQGDVEKRVFCGASKCIYCVPHFQWLKVESDEIMLERKMRICHDHPNSAVVSLVKSSFFQTKSWWNSTMVPSGLTCSVHGGFVRWKNHRTKWWRRKPFL